MIRRPSIRAPGRWLAVALLALVGCAAAPRGEAAGTVVEAFQAALRHHPEAPLHLARLRTGEGYRQQADSLLGGDPELSLLAKTDAWTSDDGYREYEVGLSLPMWLSGQRDAQREFAAGLESSARAQFRLLAWRVAGDTLDLAWKLRFAEARAGQARLQWRAAAALEAEVRERFEAGELARTDLELARQDTLERESAHEDALAAVDQALAVWQGLTGWTELPVDLGREERLAGPPTGPHPLIEASAGDLSAARARARSVRLSRRSAPVVTLYGKRDRGAGDDDYNNSLGAELSLAFGAHAHAAPRIAEAEAMVTEAEVALTAARQERDLGIVRATRSLERADRALALARRRDALARSRAKLTKRAFKLGETGLYPLLIARQQAAAAARDLELGRLVKQRAAGRYNHALGAMPE